MKKRKNIDEMEIQGIVKKKNKKAGFMIIIISLFLTIIMFFSLLYIEKNILSQYDKVKVVMLKKDLPKNTDITNKNKKDIFIIKEVYEETVPAGTYKTLKEVPTGLLSENMLANEILTNIDIKDKETYIADINNPVMTCLNGATIDNAVGGTLRRGDRISISVMFNNQPDSGERVFENIYISEAMTADGNKIKLTSDEVAVLFNIILSAEDEQKLNNMISRGGILRICKVNDIEY